MFLALIPFALVGLFLLGIGLLYGLYIAGVISIGTVSFIRKAGFWTKFILGFIAFYAILAIFYH